MIAVECGYSIDVDWGCGSGGRDEKFACIEVTSMDGSQIQGSFYVWQDATEFEVAVVARTLGRWFDREAAKRIAEEALDAATNEVVL